ncbi:MAG: glutamate racemase [Xylophilus ampelinus]
MPDAIDAGATVRAAASASDPIGVFDSGIGGLSVLQALRADLPHERLVYLADSGHAPYGERGEAHAIARTAAIAGQLRQREGIKALVIACNTATTAAVHLARAAHPDLPIVGVEPAVKPAVAASRTGRIGVIGTRGTLASARFGRLLASLDGQAEFVVQPCDGLAAAIEEDLLAAADDRSHAIKTEALCAEYTRAMGSFGTGSGAIDTLVLGCTHYVFAAPVLRRLLGPEVAFVETGAPVARQTRRLLAERGLLRAGSGSGARPAAAAVCALADGGAPSAHGPGSARPPQAGAPAEGTAAHAAPGLPAATLHTTGADLSLLRAARDRWLQEPAPVRRWD